MEALLNFSVPLDVTLLDRVVNVLSIGSPAEVCKPTRYLGTGINIIFHLYIIFFFLILGALYFSGMNSEPQATNN